MKNIERIFSCIDAWFGYYVAILIVEEEEKSAKNVRQKSERKRVILVHNIKKKRKRKLKVNARLYVVNLSMIMRTSFLSISECPDISSTHFT